MKTSSFATTAALVAGAAAQNMSLCDKYTTALLMENNATNQQTLLTLVVNTVVIGNYTMPNVGIAVPGILAPGTGDFQGVELAPYFSGALLSTNNGSDAGVSVSFLDGGGAAPLMNNMAAEDNTSAQYTLLTHLYQYFGTLLGCSQFSNTTEQYGGRLSMYEVHKYMGLNNAEVGYFINQVGMAAASFGVSDADVATVGKALTDAFGYRCSPAASIPASATAELQAICIESDCPEAPTPDCSAYAAVVQPAMASSSGSMSTSMPTGSMTTGSSMPSGTGGAATTGSMAPTSDVAALPVLSGLSAAVLGLVAFLL